MNEHYLSYIIALALNVVAGLVVYTLLNSVWVAILVFVVLLLAMLAFYSRAYWVIGFRGWGKKRTDLRSTRECLDLVDTSLDYLGVIALAHVPEAEWIKKVKGKAAEGCRFRFLLLNPSSRYAEQREKDGGSYRVDLIGSHLRILWQLKGELGSKGEKIEVRIYDEYPVWCIMIIDQKICALSFYGRGRPGVKSPVVLLRPGSHSFYEACRLHFDKLWERAVKIRRLEDLEAHLSSH